MLPPFKIRNLRRSALNPPYSNPDAIGAGSNDSIVRITVPEYDSTISRYPEATLKYYDEDDCDVGTSLELSQRLDEPLPPQAAIKQTHHIFDINDGVSPSSVWKVYEQNQQTKEPENPRVDHGRYVSESLRSGQTILEGARFQYPEASNTDQYQRHFQASNSPNLHTSKDDDSKAERARQRTRQPFPNSFAQLQLSKIAASSPHMTSEGKRQAMLAGDRIRAIASPSRYSRNGSSSMDSIDAEKRWASYSTSASPFLEQLPTPILDSRSSHSDYKRQPQSAGDKLRSRTSRIRHFRPSQDQGLLTDYGITKARCAYSGAARTVRFEDDESPGNKGKEASGTDVGFHDESSQSLLELFESELASAKKSQYTPKSSKTPISRPTTSAASKVQQLQCELSDSLTESDPAKVGLDCRPLGALSSRPSNESQDEQQLEKPNAGGENTSKWQSPQRNGLADHSLNARYSHQDQAQTEAHSANLPSGQPDVCQSITRAVDGIGKFICELQKHPTTSDRHACQNIGQALQLGLLAALQGFDVCLQNISNTVDNALANADGNNEMLRKLLHSITSSMGGLSMPATPGEAPPASPDAHRVMGADKQPEDSVACKGKGRMSTHSSLPSHATTQASTSFSQRPPEKTIKSTNSFNVPFSFLDSSHKAPCSSSNLPASRYTNDPRYGSLTRQPPFPLLPTMEPLIPSKEPDSLKDETSFAKDKDTDPVYKPSEPAALNVGRKCQQARVTPTASEAIATLALPESMRGSESSGQFFNRMTGRGSEAACTVGVSPSRVEGIQRSEIAGERRAEASSSRRRPRSIQLSRHSRMPWDSLYDGPPTPPIQYHQTGSGDRAHLPTDGALPAQHYEHRGVPLEVATAVEHHDASTAGKISECVEQLRMLGYGVNGDHGTERLIVLAQAADGDVSDAIDMIDEEQQVYSQRH